MQFPYAVQTLQNRILQLEGVIIQAQDRIKYYTTSGNTDAVTDERNLIESAEGKIAELRQAVALL